MNPNETYIAVGYTHADINGGPHAALANMNLLPVQKMRTMKQRGDKFVRRVCEICFLQPEAEAEKALYQMLGVNENYYPLVYFLNQTALSVAADFKVPLAAKLGAYRGKDLLKRFGGFGTLLHFPVFYGE